MPKDELRHDLLRALESLPEIYREAITREATRSRIHRGRALLREYLRADERRP